MRVPIDSSSSDTKNPSPSKSSVETQYSSSTTQFDHIPTMPSFEESSGSLINVSDELDVTSKETDPVEVNTVQELIGPPIVDVSPMSAESETSETVSLYSVKIVNRDLRANCQRDT